MNKYLLSGLSGAALLLLVSTPVSANYMPMHFPHMPSGPTVSNDADIENDIVVNANTGGNFQSTFGQVSLTSGGSGVVAGENDLFTGNAGAAAMIQNMANIGGDCGCEPGAKVENDADIENDVEVNANTGGNVQMTEGSVRIQPTMVMTRHHHQSQMPTGEGGVSGLNYMETGDALGTAEVWNLVNSSYVMP